VNRYDYVIVGSGIAGLFTALLARDHGSVAILTKGRIDDSNTRYAQGGIAAAIGKNDSSDLHFQDTIAAGGGLCKEESVRILVDEAPARIADLVKLGVPFDTLDGEIALTREAAHSVSRILHAGGDATGEHIENTLSRRVRLSGIQVLESCLATRILTEDGRVTGVRALDCHTGSLEEFGCRYLILATGGAGQLYKFTTNSEVATGDGIALAYAAGAEITDLEFFQFHPTALHLPGVTPFLISEAVRGEGGVLRNASGRRFMPDYAPEADLATRDVVARSIMTEMKKTGTDKVFLDVTHQSPHVITTRFPHIYRFCLEHGLDITRNLIPVAPAAHYQMGGVKTNTWGETNIAGLFACGETACTGVHGANRLASNSLLEVVVFSNRIIEKTAGNGAITAHNHEAGDVRASLTDREDSASLPALSLSALQQLNWDMVGIVRNQKGLTRAAAILDAWQGGLPPPVDRPTFELSNLILTSRLAAEAALTREESRGAHFRSDFTDTLSDWRRHIVFTRTGG
jgi:L-aspartate oxidase